MPGLPVAGSPSTPYLSVLNTLQVLAILLTPLMMFSALPSGGGYDSAPKPDEACDSENPPRPTEVLAR